MSKIPQEAIGLLPCPFCGDQAERIDIDDGDNAGGSFICCTACQASGNIEFGYKENFVSNWNRRADAARAQGAEVEPFAWACRDYADGWIVYEDKKKATEYQEETSCLMIPVYTTPPAPQPTEREKVLTSEEKEQVLLRIIEGMGGETDSSDCPRQWLNWFCNDEIAGEKSDTFNRCNDKGWLSTTHCTDFDTSTTWLTKEGRTALASEAPSQTDRAEGGE